MTAANGRARALYPRRGEIWAVELPNQPADQQTPRPALVVSIDLRNRLARDVIVVPLTTNLSPLPTHIFIPAGAGGQHQDSVAKCEQLTTLDKQLLVNGPFAGRLPEPLMSEVVKAIRRAIGEIVI